MSSTTAVYSVNEYNPATSTGGLIASQSLARGSVVKATLDLTAKLAGWVRVRTGPLGTTAPGTAPTIGYKPITANAYSRHPVTAQYQGNTSSPSSTTCATSDSNAGQAVLTVSSGTGFAAGDQIIIGAGTIREEYALVSKVSGATITLEDNLLYTHTVAGADAVTNKANVFPDIFLQGGKKYEIAIDYGAAGSGSNLQVVADVVTLDSYTTT